MKILITGGSGMVGKNLTDTIKQYHHVLVPTRQELDLFDFNTTCDYLSKHKPDLVIHCAGKVGGIQANIKDPTGFLVENTTIGQNIVTASRKNGIKKLINLGSSCMYPKDRSQLKESDLLTGLLEPTNEGYAIAKIYVAKLCEYINKEDPEFEYKTLIPCNLYGPHDDFHTDNSHLLPAIIKKIHHALSNNLEQIEVWGDGHARREFMYVGDLCDFILKIIPNINQLPELLNVGLGFDHSINDYYLAACNVLGFKGQLVHNLSKPVGMKRKMLNTDLQKYWTNNKPTDLFDGIQSTYNFYLNNLS